MEEMRNTACRLVHALTVGDFALAESFLHPEVSWWMTGAGTVPYQRVRELIQKNNGTLATRGVEITGTVVEGDKVAMEVVGAMKFADGRSYSNAYHHLIRFKDGLVIEFREYFDTKYVLESFGEGAFK
jgi:hypothetical protein